MFKSFIDKTFWTFVHFLGHILDFDKDGKLDIGDLKVVFAKFTEILPDVTALWPAWNTMNIGDKLNAIFAEVRKQLPNLATISDFILIILEGYAHVSLKLKNPPPKLGPIPKD